MPKRPERSKTRPPSNPEHHQSINPPPGAASQLVAENANDHPNRQVKDGATNETTHVRNEGPERPKRPKNLTKECKSKPESERTPKYMQSSNHQD